MSMRRRLLISTLLLIGAATGGHYYLWKQHAEYIQQQVESTISKINAQKPMFSYGSLSTSGYPSRVLIVIENPKFSGRVDEWLQLFADAGAKSHLERAERQAAIDGLPEWVTDTSINGRVVLSSNLLADHYTVTVSGPLTSTNEIAGFKESSISEPQGDTHCDVTLFHHEGLFQRLLKTLKQEQIAMGELASLDCRFPATRYVSNANELLTSSGGGLLRMTRAPESQANQKFELAFSLKDFAVSEAGDKLIEMYMRTLSPDTNYSNRLSIYANQSIDLDFSYHGPQDLQQMTATTPIRIALNKLSIHNAVYQTDLSFLLSKTTVAGKQDAKLVMNARSTFSEAYQAMLRDLVLDLSREMLAQPVSNFDLSHFSAESLNEALQPAIPNFASLGTLTQAIDASYSGNENFTEGDATLNQLELSATPYGITGKGNAKLASGQMKPSGNLNLECTQCSLMLDDMANYLGRVKQTLTTLDPSRANDIPIEPADIARLKTFLSQLATHADNGLWRFSIISDPASGPSINGKSMLDVMALYQQHMAIPSQP